MASSIHVDPAALKLAQERADEAAEARRDAVESSPEYVGREALARTLLQIKDPHRMMADEIMRALAAALRTTTEVAAPPPSFGAPQDDMAMARMFLTPKQVIDEELYQKGAAAAKFLLGKN